MVSDMEMCFAAHKKYRDTPTFLFHTHATPQPNLAVAFDWHLVW